MRGGGVLGIVSLSLIGVGFSSWLISSKEDININAPLGNVNADGDFCDINKYLTVTNVDTSDFNYSSTFGFLGPNDEVIDNYKGSIVFYGSFSDDEGSLSSHFSSSLSTLKRNCSLEGGSAVSVFGSCISEAKLAFGQNDLYDFNSSSSYTGLLKNASTGNEVISFPASVFLNKQELKFGIKYTFNKPSGSHSFSSMKMSVSIRVEI